MSFGHCGHFYWPSYMKVVMNLVQLHFRLQLFSEQAASNRIRLSLAGRSHHGQIDLLLSRQAMEASRFFICLKDLMLGRKHRRPAEA
jgi:hypothetical protein